VPGWVYIPSLHAIFGLGAGLHETLHDDALHGLRNIFFLGTDLEKTSPSPILLSEQHVRHYAHNTKLREHLPALVIYGTDGERLHRVTETDDGYALVTSNRIKPRSLCARHDYAVSTSKDERGEPELTLYRRTRRLKPAWSDKRASESRTVFRNWITRFIAQRLSEREKELQRIHAAHLDYLENRERLSDPGVQHQIRKISQATVLKKLGYGQKPKKGGKSYGAKATPTPITKPEAALPARLPAPTDPLPDAISMEMSRIARQRLGEISRKEYEVLNDEERRLKKPHTEHELLKRALGVMARRDVVAMLYDYSLVPIARFCRYGLRVAATEDGVPTTPSINP
jgi:hypothetical protein